MLATPREPLLPTEVDVVIYHKNCEDGFGSAFVAWLFSKDRKVEYYPVSIGMDPPREISGKNVLVCDFSFDEKMIERMLGKVRKLLILDHHQTSEKKLANLHPCYKVFEMKKSGVILTWEYFFPGKAPPAMISYIGDHDIWTHALPEWKNFTSWFFTVPKTFEEYNKYLNDDYFLVQVKENGPPLRKFNDYQIEESLKYVSIRFCKINKSFYFVAYLNSTLGFLISELGNKMVLKNPKVDFAAVYFILDDSSTTKFSLRSTDEQEDVGSLAATMNGGGHRNASGLWIGGLINRIPGTVYDLDIRVLETVKEIHLSGHRFISVQSDRYRHKLGIYLLQSRKIKVKVAEKKFIDEVRQIGALLVKSKESSPFSLAAVISPILGSTKCCFTISFASDVKDDYIEQIREHFHLDEKGSFIEEMSLIQNPQ